MTNFFDFQTDKVIAYSENNPTEFLEHKFNESTSFFQEELKDFIREQSKNGNPNAFYWYSPTFTLLPQSVFKLQDVSSYLRLNFGSIKQEEVATFDMLHSQNAVIAYSLPKWIKEIKDTYFPLIPLKHQAGQLVARTRGQYSDFVSVIIYDSSFVLTLLKNGKLTICNSFEYQNETDLIYYLLLHIQKHELSISTKIVIYNYQSNIPIDQIKELTTNFSEFDNFQFEWKSKNEFYKTILCV